MNLTLRDRLQQRRERIAAGLPPPPPVTMTENFFTSNITSARTRTCSECDTEFVPHGKQVTCSPECYDKRTSRLRSRGTHQLRCDECGAEFTSNNPRAVVCGDACRLERRRRHGREWMRDHAGKKKEPLEPRVCAADGCDTVFTPIRPNHATCGATRCRRRHQRAKQREHNAAFYAKKRMKERQAERIQESQKLWHPNGE